MQGGSQTLTPLRFGASSVPCVLGVGYGLKIWAALGEERTAGWGEAWCSRIRLPLFLVLDIHRQGPVVLGSAMPRGAAGFCRFAPGGPGAARAAGSRLPAGATKSGKAPGAGFLTGRAGPPNTSPIPLFSKASSLWVSWGTTFSSGASLLAMLPLEMRAAMALPLALEAGGDPGASVALEGHSNWSGRTEICSFGLAGVLQCQIHCRRESRRQTTTAGPLQTSSAQFGQSMSVRKWPEVMHLGGPRSDPLSNGVGVIDNQHLFHEAVAVPYPAPTYTPSANFPPARRALPGGQMPADLSDRKPRGKASRCTRRHCTGRSSASSANRKEQCPEPPRREQKRMHPDRWFLMGGKPSFESADTR